MNASIFVPGLESVFQRIHVQAELAVEKIRKEDWTESVQHMYHNARLTGLGGSFVRGSSLLLKKVTVQHRYFA